MRTAIRRGGLGLVLGLCLLGLSAPSFAAPSKAWLGVMTQSVTEELRDALDLRGDGVLVNRVVIDSPADRAGIKKGDIITSVSGRSVESPADLSEAVQDQQVGATATVKVLRRGATQSFSVKLGARPSSFDDEDRWSTPTPGPDSDGATRIRAFKNGKEVDPDDIEIPGLEGLRHLDGLGAMPRSVFWNDRPRLGVRLQEMNPDLASYFGGTNGKGALVVEVIEDTPAEKAGIKAGDVITAVGSTSVDDAEDLSRVLADEEGKVSLSVVRKGARRTIEADLGDAPRRSMTWRMRDGRAPKAPGSMRFETRDDQGDSDLRREMQQLRDELREMKKQLEDKNR